MSEFKVGDKCRLSDAILKGLKMGMFVGQRWTIKAVNEQERVTIEMDNEDVELSLGPLPPKAISAWTEDDERELEAMPPLF
jgi:hypothetical protein